MIVIAGRSAWEWWRTPPVVREIELDMEDVRSRLGKEIPSVVLHERKNASESARLVVGRLLGELKGVSLPVDVVVPQGHYDGRTRLLNPRRSLMADCPKHLVDRGGGLHVASVELAVIQMAAHESLVGVIEAMCEACGLYALCPQTGRNLVALELMRSFAAANDLTPQSGVAAYTDEWGRRIPHYLRDGEELAWTPCVDRHGSWTSIWKRSPLTQPERIVCAIADVPGLEGRRRAARAARYVCGGSGSPLETKVVMLICLPPMLGGEHLPFPELNKRIAFSEGARRLAGMRCCVADMLWPKQRVVVEVNGLSFHADRDGFIEHSGRRAALEADGYRVIDINYTQAAHLEQWDLLAITLAKALGRRPQARTARFLHNRDELHSQLFHHADKPEGALLF